MNVSFPPKSQWGKGPWQKEPDEADWIDDATGYPCRAVRHPEFGNWCGYVAVPPDHPGFLQNYAVAEQEGVSVHGGITFSGTLQRVLDEVKTWWFGFDCAHFMDYSPGLVALQRSMGWRKIPPSPEREVVYRDLDYVKAQCTEMALQLAQWAWRIQMRQGRKKI